MKVSGMKFGMMSALASGAIALLANAMPGYAAKINFSMGEDGAAPASEQVPSGGEYWNNLRTLVAPITGLVDSTNAAVAGVSAIQSGTSTNPNEALGNGYITSPNLDSVTQSLVYALSGGTTSLVISGLTPGSVWNVAVFAGLSGDIRLENITVNGSTQSGGFGAAWTSHAPLTYSSVTAVGGVITISAVNVNAANNGDFTSFLEAASITAVPEPTTLSFALVAGAGLLRRRRS